MREVIVMQGVPGSGKSTIAHKIDKERGRSFSIISADDFFYTDSIYLLDPAYIGEAHALCLRRFIARARLGCGGLQDELIIVDNTSTTVAELAPYMAIAAAYDYVPKILRVDCPVSIAAARNIHGVPEKVVMDMQANIDKCVMPKWWRLEVIPYEQNSATVQTGRDKDASGVSK